MLAFLRQNKVSGFVFLGDQFDNQDISHHTKGKPGLRRRGRFHLDEVEFEEQILTPLEEVLPAKCIKVWIQGNHDTWSDELAEEQPELIGKLDRPTNLRLVQRGWRVFAEGKTYRYGKLSYAHGESLGGMHHAKKAVETFCRSLVYGHFHSPQLHTKVLPQDQSQKWSAQCLPILGDTNPQYLEGKPHAWVNGFGIAEYHGSEKAFNVYPIVVTNGRFAYGGKVYEG
jgi:predicted phosphodiesterase